MSEKDYDLKSVLTVCQDTLQRPGRRYRRTKLAADLPTGPGTLVMHNADGDLEASTLAGPDLCKHTYIVDDAQSPCSPIGCPLKSGYVPYLIKPEIGQQVGLWVAPGVAVAPGDTLDNDGTGILTAGPGPFQVPPYSEGLDGTSTVPCMLIVEFCGC